MMKKLIFICYFYMSMKPKYAKFKELLKKKSIDFRSGFFYIVLKKMLPRPFDILQKRM